MVTLLKPQDTFLFSEISSLASVCMDPAMPTHSTPHRLKTPIRLEFLGSGKTATRM